MSRNHPRRNDMTHSDNLPLPVWRDGLDEEYAELTARLKDQVPCLEWSQPNSAARSTAANHWASCALSGYVFNAR